MRNIVCMLCFILVILSCSKENTPAPLPQAAPLLKRTVETNPSGFIMRVSHYNILELVAFDTIFLRPGGEMGMTHTYTYNAKGRQILHENTIPVLYTGGPHWAYRDEYKNDTIPSISYRYLKGKQVAEITHFYNATGQLVLDSTYHTPNYGIFTYLKKYEYDASGRLSSTLDLNDNRDTTEYISYQYTTNRVESSTLKIEYIGGTFRFYGMSAKEYTPDGKILSEKTYNAQTLQLSTQIDYTYDANGRLLKKTTGPNAPGSLDERYFYNLLTGKLDKIEYYTDGQLIRTKTYYYE